MDAIFLFNYPVFIEFGRNDILLNESKPNLDYNFLTLINKDFVGNIEQYQGIIPTESILVQFHPRLIQKLYGGSSPLIIAKDMTVKNGISASLFNSLIENYIQNISTIIKTKDEISEDFIILKLNEIMSLLYHGKRKYFLKIICNAHYDKSTLDFIKQIEENVFKAQNLKDLAVQTNMSVATFKRRFSKIYQETPKRYLLNRRIEKVALLLKSTNENISSIAFECGFVAPEHLSRVFKSKYGRTPSQFRNDFIKNGHLDLIV
ncbi:helix-turn-helix transcriptional regulator [Winogradskyella sp.]